MSIIVSENCVALCLVLESWLLTEKPTACVINLRIISSFSDVDDETLFLALNDTLKA